MPAWNLALRFVLELAALVGIAVAAWSLTDGAWRWVISALAVAVAATVWGTFNVVGDPSRSGRAPVAVSGVQRLAVEFLVLGLGVVGLLVIAPRFGVASAIAVVIHYGASWPRVSWLVRA